MFVRIFMAFLVFATGLLANSRTKRLVWPPGGDKVQVIAGVGIPADLERETVIFGMVYKANYALPNNISQISNLGTTIYQRRRRSAIENNKLIQNFERSLPAKNEYSRTCILRTICELSSVYFDENLSLEYELLQVILTHVEGILKNSHELSYREAYNIGKENVENCASMYEECEKPIVEISSTS